MKYKQSLKAFLLGSFLSISTLAFANEVDIVDVKAHQSKNGTWSFAVTLKHADEGWDHYANEWQVLAPDNKILATRTLYHPHVNEQPFTRNTSGVKIPMDMRVVYVIAKDTVHGLAKKAVKVNLNTKEITPTTVAELRKMRK
ncbi:MAG: hypothetical protein L3J51_10190 [Cocleimonas sp.]|nr:hypothetical protein [Cocleimonas sp.]